MSAHVFATQLKVGFTLLFVGIFAVSRALLGFSTLETFLPPK